jgi:hypothetical protein
MFALPIAAAIIPALLLLAYFHARDIYPEPPRVVWTTFFLGVLTIPFVLVFALPLSQKLAGIHDPYLYGLADAFLCAAIPEEAFKFLVLSRYAARHPEFNEPMDGIVYGVAASLGFATLENILYVGHGGMGVAALRGLTAVPGHAFTGAVMGYFVGRARFASRDQDNLWALALVTPILLHGLYDFPLLVISHLTKDLHARELPAAATLLTLLTLATLGFEWRLAVRLVQRLRDEQEAGRAPAAVAGDVAMAPAAVPVARAARQPRPVLGTIAVWSGGLLVTAGALFALFLVLGLFTTAPPKGHPRDLASPLLGGVVICSPLILIGLRLFRAGIRRLNAAGPPRPLPAAP